MLKFAYGVSKFEGNKMMLFCSNKKYCHYCRARLKEKEGKKLGQFLDVFYKHIITRGCKWCHFVLIEIILERKIGWRKEKCV